MTDLELLYIVVEGAVDRFVGRPREANPYAPKNARDWHEAWLLGWDDAHELLAERGANEAARWLREDAP